LKVFDLQSLARIPLFKSLDERAIRLLDGQCTWRRAKAKEFVLEYKDGGTHLYFVAQGHLRVLIQTTSGKDSILRDIRDGEYFGELPAIDARPRSAAILAITDSDIAKMPTAVFRETVHRYPAVCDQLLILLASQVRMLANRVNEYATFDVRRRLYAELLRLARPTPKGDTQTIISPPPTHAELAARVSTHREAITRELNDLERSGLLERRRGAMVLLDPMRLAKLIEEAEEG
jgi:CRP/FNR family transcriptional regulator, cyclic AMP receptor protein